METKTETHEPHCPVPRLAEKGEGAICLCRARRDVPTWTEQAAEALAVQDACNLIAVAGAFARVVKDVRDRLELDGLAADTMAVRQHPVVCLWVDKIYDLCGGGVTADGKNAFAPAYAWCVLQFPF